VPMPPPKPSTDQGAGRRTQREVVQLTRALADKGPLDHAGLAEVVGAAYWEVGRFDRALIVGVDSGRIVRDKDGRYAAT
jgi:hypothetical protein